MSLVERKDRILYYLAGLFFRASQASKKVSGIVWFQIRVASPLLRPSVMHSAFTF